MLALLSCAIVASMLCGLARSIVIGMTAAGSGIHCAAEAGEGSNQLRPKAACGARDQHGFAIEEFQISRVHQISFQARARPPY
jgi:hypothetical protein